jgi:hypothetical protein
MGGQHRKVGKGIIISNKQGLVPCHCTAGSIRSCSARLSPSHCRFQVKRPRCNLRPRSHARHSTPFPHPAKCRRPCWTRRLAARAHLRSRGACCCRRSCSSARCGRAGRTASPCRSGRPKPWRRSRPTRWPRASRSGRARTTKRRPVGRGGGGARAGARCWTGVSESGGAAGLRPNHSQMVQVTTRIASAPQDGPSGPYTFGPPSMAPRAPHVLTAPAARPPCGR